MNNKNPDRSPTTIGTYGLAVQKALQASGYDATGIFAAAGIAQTPSNPPGETDDRTGCRSVPRMREAHWQPGRWPDGGQVYAPLYPARTGLLTAGQFHFAGLLRASGELFPPGQ